MSHFYNSYVAAPVAAAPGPAPMRPHRAPSPTDDAIVQQVEWYMGRPNLHQDDYLKHKMNDDLWVSLDVILAFPKMMRIGVTDKRRVASLLHARSTVVEVDEANCRIRPYWARRSALLLHDVPHLTRYEQVMLLFQLDNSNNSNTNANTSTASANTASNSSNSPHPKQPPPPSLIQPISDTSWIVNFDSPTAAQIFRPLIAEKSINGQKISVELVPDVLRSPQAAAVHDPFRQSSQPAPMYPRPIASATPAGTPLTPHDHLRLSVSAAPPFAPHPAALSSPMLSPMPLPMPVLHPHHPADMHPPPFAPPYNPNGGTPPPPVPHSAPPPPPPGAYTYAPASMPMPRPPFLGARTMPPTPAYIMPYQTPPHFDPSAAVAAVAAAHVPMQAAQMQSHNPNHSHGLPHGHSHNHHISPHSLAHHVTATHHSHSNVLPHPQSPILHQATHGLIAHGSPASAVANDVGGSGVGGNGALTLSGSTNGSVSGGGGGGVSGAVGSGGTENTENETYNNGRASMSSSSTSDPSPSGNNGTTNQSQGQNNSSTSIGSVAEQLKDVNIKGDVSSRSPDSLVSFPTDSISNGDINSRVNSSGKLSMAGAGVPTPEDRLSTPSISNASIDVPTTPRQSQSSRFNPQRNGDGPQSAPHSAPPTPHMSGMGYSRPHSGSQSIASSNSHHSHMSHHGSGHNHNHNHGHGRHHYHNYHNNSNHYGGASGNHGGNGSNGGFGNGMYAGGRDRHHGRNGTNFDGGMRYNNHYNHHHNHHHTYHNHHHNNHYNHGHHGHHNHGHHGQHHMNNGNHNGNSGHNNGPNHTPHSHQHHPHGHHHHHYGGMQGRGSGSSFDGNNRGFNGQSHHRKGKKGNRGQHNHGRHPNHERFGSDPRIRNNHHHHLNSNNPNTNNNTNANGNGSNNMNMSVNGMNNRNESTTPLRSQSPNTCVEHNVALTSAQQAHQNTNFSTPPNHSTNSNLPEQTNSRDDSRVNTNPHPKDEPNLATMNFPPLGVNANSNPRNSTGVPVKKSDCNANTLKDIENDVSLESNVASSPLPLSSQSKKATLEKAKVPDVGSTAAAAVSEQSKEDKDVKTSSAGVKNGSNQSSPPAPICKDNDGSEAGKNIVPAASSGSAKEAKGDDAGSEGPGRKHSERRTDSNNSGMSYAAILRSNKPTPAPVRQAGKNGTFTRTGGITKAPTSNVTGAEISTQTGSNASSESQSKADKVDSGEAGSLNSTPGGDGKEASDKDENGGCEGGSDEKDGVDEGNVINDASKEDSKESKDGAGGVGGGGGIITGSTVSAAGTAVETTVETASGEAASNSGSCEADAESARSNFVWANKPKSVFEAVKEVKT